MAGVGCVGYVRMISLNIHLRLIRVTMAVSALRPLSDRCSRLVGNRWSSGQSQQQKPFVLFQNLIHPFTICRVKAVSIIIVFLGICTYMYE